MSALLSLTPALLLASLGLWAFWRGVDLYRALTEGAQKGLRLLWEILPSLTVLFAAVYLLRASGLPERLGTWLAPLLDRLGIPRETALLMLLRPLSGSGALSVASEIIRAAGADSLTGRTAAVMIGSSETTLYVTALYFSAAGVKRSRWTLPAAVCADLACFLSSAWLCRLFWG